MGQLGIEPTVKTVVKIPFQLKLDQIQVVQIACGKSHTALVTDNGIIYSMGSNKKGQLGIGQNNVE